MALLSILEDFKKVIIVFFLPFFRPIQPKKHPTKSKFPALEFKLLDDEILILRKSIELLGNFSHFQNIIGRQISHDFQPNFVREFHAIHCPYDVDWFFFFGYEFPHDFQTMKAVVIVEIIWLQKFNSKNASQIVKYIASKFQLFNFTSIFFKYFFII